MSEKYEEKLWGKIDFLHQKTNQEQTYLNIFSDIITRYCEIISDFSKSIDNIKNWKTRIINEKDTSSYKLYHSFKLNLKAHIDEFKECAEQMKLTIIGPITQSIEEKYLKEKDLYNQYNKIKNIYNSSKTILEKSKKEFESNAKLCENNILNFQRLKLYDFNYTNDDTKSQERMKLSIATTKNFEDKYFQNLEEANKARENEINKQTELLKYYQILNTEFYTKINLIISFMVPIIKKMHTSILNSLENLEEQCKKLNIQKDINNFIEKNKSDLKPDEIIQFEPYYPEASLENISTSGNDRKDLEKLDINYKVILTLYENFREIRKDLNMEDEKKKYRLRFLCTKIFKVGPGVGFKPEEKSELISFLKEKSYKSYFLITLSKQRTKGRFQRSEKLIHDLNEIINYILDGSEKENDYESAKNCIILSQTFYHEIKKGKKKKKKYLFDYIKNYKWLKDLNFWEGITDYMIQTEKNKSEMINKKNNVIESESDIKNRLSNIAFSQVVSYSNNMIEFMIKKEDIIKMVDKFVKKYEIEKGMAEAIYENINNTPEPKDDDDDDDEEDDIFDDISNRPKSLTIINKNQKGKKDMRTKSLYVKNTIIEDKENIKEEISKKIDDKDLGNKNKEEKNEIIENNIIIEKNIINEEGKEKKEEKSIKIIQKEDKENIIKKEDKNEETKKEDDKKNETKKEDKSIEIKKEDKKENGPNEEKDKIKEEKIEEENKIIEEKKEENKIIEEKKED